MNRRLPLILTALLALAAGAARAQETNAPAPDDKSALQLIVRKNIFDPNRSPARRSNSGPRPPRIETFTFCGGAFDGPRAAAFFTGAGAPRRPLKSGDSINGFKVGAVHFHSVELTTSNTPPVVLDLGMSMRREENGPWKTSEMPGAAEIAPASAAATSVAAPVIPNESDVLKRLRAKREDN